ncbi:ABC transporter permease [Brevibacillus sp. SYSU BS000544]|uniref:ABC transporter permease n=1 Tax=Brevibacillus sp. SYSU BS000544 TaxID=3416443 RepID=UPI003CE56589
MKGKDRMGKITFKNILRDGSLWVAILYVLLSIILVSASFFHVKQIELSTLTRGLYGANSLFFKKAEDKGPLDWRLLDTQQKYTIFKELETTETNVLAIYYKKDTYSPGMISGRFFQENDFYNGKNLAVVGQKIDMGNFIHKNGKMYYKFHGKDYEIIGIMGAMYQSKIDTTILLNLDAVDNGDFSQDNTYVMNIEKGESIKKNNILVFKDNILNIHVFDRGDSGAQRYVNIGLFQDWLLIIVICLLISSSILFTAYWMRKKYSEIWILWLVGITVRKTCRKIVVTYLAITLMSYFLVCFMSYLIVVPYMSNQDMVITYSENLLKGYGIILLSSLISVRVSVKNIVKQMTVKGYIYK